MKKSKILKRKFFSYKKNLFFIFQFATPWILYINIFLAFIFLEALVFFVFILLRVVSSLGKH
jgi:hypothetical protein